MRRPHRSIETFDISLMAVVTKAMGAFLVLMLLLLPYYTPNQATEQDLEEIILQLRKARESIEAVSRQLGPRNGGEAMQTGLKAATTHIELTAEVVRKMRALLDKALAEVARLKAENQRLAADNEKLAAENERLTADLRKAEQEIAQLRKEIERLEDKLREGKRAVLVSVSATGCDDVWLTGYILPKREKFSYTWTSDDAPIKPEHILFANFSDNGGEITYVFAKEKAQFTNLASVTGYAPFANAIVLADLDVRAADSVVAVVKKHPRRTWAPRGADWRTITASARDCPLTFTATAKVSGGWTAMRPYAAVLKAGTAAAAILAITNDDKGIRFRAVGADEEKWFDDIVRKSLAAQAAALKSAPRKKDEKKP